MANTDERIRASYLNVLTPTLIDTFAPYHAGICSDHRRGGGFDAAGGSTPVCTRCALIGAYESQTWPENFRLSLALVFDPVDNRDGRRYRW